MSRAAHGPKSDEILSQEDIAKINALKARMAVETAPTRGEARL